jgi:hypothetical protein
MDSPVDLPLLHVIEQAEIHAMLASEAAQQAPHLHARRFRAAAGFINLNQHNTLFNRVVGVGEEEADLVGPIIEWYADHGVPPRFDICAPRRGPRLSRALYRALLAPEEWASFSRRLMAGDARSVGADRARGTDQFEIRLVESDDDLRAFVDIQITVWPEDCLERETRIAQLRASHRREDIRRYLACLRGVPVATATLSLSRDAGWLSAGAVLEHARRQGAQSALIAQRLRDMSAADRAVAATLVSPDSGSERNLRRAGFTPACDRELWLPLKWTDHPFYRGAG